MSDAEFTIDDKEFIRSMKKLDGLISSIPLQALRMAGEEIITIATPRVPKKTGTLRKRGTSQVVEDDVWVGYNIKYAAYLHERPDLNFREPGTGAKYLENAVKSNLKRVLQMCGDQWRKKLS